MADPFVAEIRIFPFNFAPTGWAWCNGQLIPISQNTALFSLLGTTYGGDGKSKGRLAVPAVGRPDQVEQGVVFRDRKQLPLAELPPGGRKVSREDPDLTDIWLCHARTS